MNSGSPKNPGSEDYDQDLNGIESQYRALRADEPPAMLDQAILNKARLATESHPIRPWNFGWMHATATAALLVLGLTLVLQQRSELTLPPPGIDRLESLNRSKPVAVDTDAVLQEKITSSGEILVETLQIEAPGEFKDASEDDLAGTLKQSLSVPEETHGADSKIKVYELRRERAAETPQRQLLEQESAMPVTEFPSGAEESQQSADKRMDEAARTPAITAAKLTSASMSVIQKNEEMPAPESSAAGDSVAADDFSRGQPDPEDWIARILEMKHIHESEERLESEAWKLELESFRQTWPDYPLPDELAKELTGSLADEPDEAPGRE